MTTSEELIDYLSSFHENSVVPDVLLIDDLQHYITQLQVISRTGVKNQNLRVTYLSTTDHNITLLCSLKFSDM